MIPYRILIFSISLLISFTAFSQEEKVQDTVKTKVSYGIRVGVDLSKPLKSYLDEDSKGFAIVGDIKVATNYYAAVELGFDDVTTEEDYMNFSTKGSFIKLGINYNAYDNWKGMENEIFIGARYAFSFFDQTLNNYTPNAYGDYFLASPIESGTEFKDLNAHWIEFVTGMKVETLNNLYLGVQISINKMISTKEPNNFKNLYVPGFNRVFSNDLGIGFIYTLSYNIPIINKFK
ncbi:DUF6048 family protein [uncultured Lutibacter sp.]|uniref:DUF6048 family protein n=1 Tax=uncultured Lutibacter sp. TaxID=437739 RepID=UPI002610DB0D|nr:DUF6048 family protein [uncultured Lutibacter sp.]